MLTQGEHELACTFASTIYSRIFNGYSGGTLARTLHETPGVVDFTSPYASPRAGRYVVGGLTQTVVIIPSDLSQTFNEITGEILRAYREWWTEFDVSASFVGFWLNEAYKVYEIEPTQTYNSHEFALAVAYGRHEKAIYDRLEDVEIFLGSGR